MRGIGITYTILMTDKTKDELWTWGNFGNRHQMMNIARAYRHFINFRVPKKTGALRNSARVLANERSAWVAWPETNKTAKYLHYQFVGEVYGPNKAFFANGEKVTDKWRSKALPGHKYPTGRMMGKPFIKHFRDGRKAIVHGYTTKRPLTTGPDWINTFKNDQGNYGEKAINIQAGRYLYEDICQKSGIKPRGGFRVHRKWSYY